MDIKLYDLLIIGAGPAGLSAGIYGARAGLKTIIIEKGIAGGTIAMVHFIENYPGFPDGISGNKLGDLMKRQCLNFGVELVYREVKTIMREEKFFRITTDSGDYLSKSVIIASGSSPRRLNVPGENELLGRGISYCATCDGPLFKNQNIAVVGCGNSGLQEGKFLFNFAKTITFIEFLPRITADKILYDYFADKKKVEFVLNSEVVSIEGVSKVEAIKVKDRKNGVIRTINVSGVFIYIGLIPNIQFVKGLVNIDNDGFIITNERFETSMPGVFAAGDIRAKEIRQIVVACSEGAQAAINAYHFLNG